MTNNGDCDCMYSRLSERHQSGNSHNPDCASLVNSEPTERRDLRSDHRLPPSDDPRTHTGATRASGAAESHTEATEGIHEQAFDYLPEIPADYHWVRSPPQGIWYLIYDRHLFPIFSMRDEYVASVHPSLLQEQTDDAIRDFMGG